MMDKIIIGLCTIIILISAHSCSELIRVVPHHKDINPAFKPYVDDFEILTGKSVGKFTMGFANLPVKGINQVIGTCFPTIFLRGEVDIDETYWYSINTIQKRSLVLHELGHCVCFLSHDISTYNDGCPKSHLFPMSVSTWCVEKYGKQMDKDLVEKCR